MNILAIDASANVCSVALSVEGQLLGCSSDTPRTHAQQILPMVQSLQQAAGIPLTDVDYIAYGCGPGSFTGLRIALSFAQGLGFGLEKPLVPVSSLLGLAATAKGVIDGEYIISMLDARMGELYWAEYQWQQGSLLEVGAPQLQAAEEVQRLLLARFDSFGRTSPAEQTSLPTTKVVGPGAACLDFALPSACVQIDETVEPLAEYFIALAVAAIQSGKTVAASQAELTYLRNSVSWNKRKRIRPA